MSSAALSLRLYRLAMRAAAPLAPGLLRSRARKGKEDPVRWRERLGRASTERPKGALVWLHGVSVGESLSLLPLIERIRARRPDVALLATTGTRTSADLLARRAPAGVIHQYAPVDTPQAIALFLDHWRPDAGLLAESELWPNLILAARRRGVRLALVSARITQKTARGWAWDGGAARELLGAFEVILAQDDASAARIVRMGGRVDGRLNLKLAAPALPVDEAALAAFRKSVGARNVILGASTHPGEEALLVSAVQRLGPRAPRPLLVLAPRHPERGRDVAAALQGAGWRVALRSAGEALDASTDTYVADTLGEMGLFFRAADVAVMGGSFFGGVGGHNPLEPARLGVPVVTGRDVANFEEVYREMLAGRQAALRADTEADLAQALGELLEDPERRSRMGRAGQAVATRRAAELDLAWDQIAPLLPGGQP